MCVNVVCLGEEEGPALNKSIDMSHENFCQALVSCPFRMMDVLSCGHFWRGSGHLIVKHLWSDFHQHSFLFPTHLTYSSL